MVEETLKGMFDGLFMWITNNYIQSLFTTLFCSIGHTVRLFGQKKKEGHKIGGAALNLPKIRKNPLIEIIAINTGYVSIYSTRVYRLFMYETYLLTG